MADYNFFHLNGRRTKKTKQIAYKKLALWYNALENAVFKSFNIIANTIKQNCIKY